MLGLLAHILPHYLRIIACAIPCMSANAPRDFVLGVLDCERPAGSKAVAQSLELKEGVEDAERSKRERRPLYPPQVVSGNILVLLLVACS